MPKDKQEFKEYTKKDIEQFMEDSFIDNGPWDKHLAPLLKDQQAKLEMKYMKDKPEAELVIRIKLHEE